MSQESGILGLRSTTIEVDVEPAKGAQIVGLRQPGCDDVLARYDGASFCSSWNEDGTPDCDPPFDGTLNL